MDLSLEQRLLRFLGREEEDERRSSRDLRALSVSERVLEGECIEGATFRGASDGEFRFSVGENLSKFRQGDPLAVGDGVEFESAVPLVYGRYDADAESLILERDPFARGVPDEFEVGLSYCVDRRPLGLRGRLQDVVRAGFADELIRAVLEGRHVVVPDNQRALRARQVLATTCLNPPQLEAAVTAIGTDSLALVQGPPGTGKTRMLAEAVAALCAKGCRIALTAFTHRAVDNVLFCLRTVAPELFLAKLGNPGRGARELRAAGIHRLDPRRSPLPTGGAVIAGTCFALAKLPAAVRFHFTVFDEAGQLPVPHAIAGMLRSRHWVFVGDHRQLPPVITAHHADREVTASIFEWLHRCYGSHLLDLTYRMNASVCAVVSELFYRGKLHSAPAAADRRMAFVAGGRYDPVLDPEHGVVWARVDHRQPGTRSPEEADLIADLVAELRDRHAVPAAEIAVIAPFRSQVHLIRSTLERRGIRDLEALTVDTVERIQGQEREVVLISLAVGDPDTLDRRAAFFFSVNRLNVAISRARTKVILVASEGAFRALPMDPEDLRAATVFKRLRQSLPEVDLTAAHGSLASRASGDRGRPALRDGCR